ncbi:uncharacterized protein LOC117120753 [Anneissia japonica]|uniref:uncharacterized protein LOC117120753 n=1 Tax=Anneissia japonica TaxID=1529436 RepID=UPI001425B4BA|nr:uncharacterized protein LOC117120753 [Anneissia japonica]
MDLYELEDDLDYKILEELSVVDEAAEDQENGVVVADIQQDATKDVTANDKDSRKKKMTNKSRTKKISIDRPAGKFTEDNMLMKVKDYVTSAFKLLVEDPVYNNKRYPIAKRVMSLVKELEKCSESEIYQNFWVNCAKMIWQVIMAGNAKKLKPGADEKMCQAFHQYTIASVGRWVSLLVELEIDAKGHHVKSMNQFLQRTLLRLILADKNKVDVPEYNVKECPELDKHTEQVIRYVSGYIPYVLVKRFKKGKSQTAKVYCEVLSQWQVKSDSATHTFLSYSREWIDRQNRSGLFTVNDDVFLFFRNVEFETRKHLTVNQLSSMSEIDYLDVMFQKVVENKIIQTYWCKLTRESLGDNASKQLLDIIIKYWIKIRANAST